MADIKPIVFVVDDDLSIREALETLIRSLGWDVRLFESPTPFLRMRPLRDRTA